MNPSKNICKRCLLRDLAKEDQANITKYIQEVTDRVSPEIYESRLEICRGCDLLDRGTCNACGCYVELRALGQKARCPHKNW